MTIALVRRLGQSYAFVVAGLIFVVLLIAAGRTAAPGVLILPLEQTFGWSRGVISSSAALGILLYGLGGPFAAAVMQRYGLRRTLVVALAMVAVSTGGSAFMTQPWQLILSWGLISGLASSSLAVVLGATVVNRWFYRHRGLMMGILTASTATGTLLFLPALALLVQHGGWRPVVWVVSAASACMIPLVWFLLPERPADVGLRRLGAPEDEPEPEPGVPQPIFSAALGVLAMAMRHRDFWFLAATFFVCGFTTSGLVGTHLIAMCGDYGIPEVRAAGLLAAMGLFDLLGTTLSGWLTDRFDPRKLLFVYYGLRGLSLMLLPYSAFDTASLTVFAVFYGLDWIATVPPTLRLATDAFGERAAPVVFAWIVAAHQLGGAAAASFAGFMRQLQGSYTDAFLIAGSTAVVAAVLSMAVRGRQGGAPSAA